MNKRMQETIRKRNNKISNRLKNIHEETSSPMMNTWVSFDVAEKIPAVSEGQMRLFGEYRYFFYITNIEDVSPVDLLKLIRGRCNHENKIEQLDNGVHALKMPVTEFMANWAYMTICMLAWNLKSWIALLLNDKKKSSKLIACEFKRFQNTIINIPGRILFTGRRIVYRFLNYNSRIGAIFDLWRKLKTYAFFIHIAFVKQCESCPTEGEVCLKRRYC